MAAAAFAARALLAEASERTLDVQYYIWHDDITGRLLFDSLRGAAERGVRVRLLLDDINTAGLDGVLAALDAHPRIEVRLFNPFAQRHWRWLGYLTDFDRLNRRMHNKSFTADNQVTIVGGRNIGDEYFDAGEGVAFIDLDVLAVGAVVDDVSQDFDRYWSSASAYPAERVLRKVDAVVDVAANASNAKREPAAQAYLDELATSPMLRELLSTRLPLEWSAARLISDDPAKGLGHAGAEALLLDRLVSALGEAKEELLLISPYFVPTAAGVDAFSTLAGRGVKIPILTNSLEATDVAAVHAGYAKRRRALIASGIAPVRVEAASGAACRREASGPAAARRPACTPRRSLSIERASSSARSTSIRDRRA